MAEGGTLALLPDYILNEVPPLDEIVEHARTDCYHELGTMLGLDSEDLSNVRTDLSVSKKISAVYQIWLDKKGKGATRRRLLAALRTKHVGKNRIADEYEEKLKKMASKETKRKQSIENRQSIRAKPLIANSEKCKGGETSYTGNTGKMHIPSNERQLKIQFSALLSAIRGSIKSIDVDEVRFQVLAWLINEDYFETPELREYRKKIKEETSSSDIILFLMEERFFNYLNPQLLEDIVEVILPNDEGVKTKMTQYMKDYEKFEITLGELEQVSRHDDLGASAPSGLQEFSFEASPDMMLQEFQTTISNNIPQSIHILLKRATPGSIIMTYVALPCVASAVTKHLTNPIICEKLKSKGVRVIKPCPDAHSDSDDTIDKEMDNSEQLSLRSTLGFSQRSCYVQQSSVKKAISLECLVLSEETTDTEIAKSELVYSLPPPPSLTTINDQTYFSECRMAIGGGPTHWVMSSLKQTSALYMN